MSAIVVLAVALTVVIAVATGVVAVQLVRAMRALRQLLTATATRLEPLVEDLQAEAAVASLELEGLRTSVERLQDARGSASSSRRRGGRRRASRRH